MNIARENDSGCNYPIPYVLRKKRTGTFFLALLSAALPAASCIAADSPNPDDLTQGNWEILLSKSSFCKAAPQKSRREIFDAGWGLISVYWTGVDADGKAMEARYVYRYDGEKYPANIDKPANEAITWKLVNPFRVEFTHWSKDNKITEELIRTVSSDGQEMTQTRKYLTEKDCVDIQVFKRT